MNVSQLQQVRSTRLTRVMSCQECVGLQPSRPHSLSEIRDGAFRVRVAVHVPLARGFVEQICTIPSGDGALKY